MIVIFDEDMWNRKKWGRNDVIEEGEGLCSEGRGVKFRKPKSRMSGIREIKNLSGKPLKEVLQNKKVFHQ